MHRRATQDVQKRGDFSPNTVRRFCVKVLHLNAESKHLSTQRFIRFEGPPPPPPPSFGSESLSRAENTDAQIFQEMCTHQHMHSMCVFSGKQMCIRVCEETSCLVLELRGKTNQTFVPGLQKNNKMLKALAQTFSCEDALRFGKIARSLSTFHL